MAFAKILIANRGEIAARVIRTAQHLGYPTVAICSDVDADARHVRLADEVVTIGGAAASDSYLSSDKVLAAAAKVGADAVHPGYGFLSENAAFARACQQAGITFIGPSPEAIELMGDKRAAKAAMEEAGVPCVPGFRQAASDEQLVKAAEKVGFPVMVKAACGGGGRGMRLVTSAADLADAIRSARSEAEGAFGDGTLFLERAVTGARHVEVQIFGDTHGNVIHLGERDCSVQRRHQKVVEESPSPAVDDELRAALGAAAVAAARSCNYVGAGTVEFLVADGNFYFLEMNTRLQVEHPVTEMVTGLDLVALQIRVAEGGELPAQETIALRGHAIEVRLYAEDDKHVPQTGEIFRWSFPSAARVDHGLVEPTTISPYYDPMIAKLIVHRDTRGEARRALLLALDGTELMGVRCNKAHLAAICAHPTFATGQATTAFLAESEVSAQKVTDLDWAAAALTVFVLGGRRVCDDDEFVGWRSGGPMWSTVKLRHGSTASTSEVRSLRVSRQGKRFEVRHGDASLSAEVAMTSDSLDLLLEGVSKRFRYGARGDEIWIGNEVFVNETHHPAVSADAKGSGRLVAPLDGAVIDVRVVEGQHVARGALLMVVEAMKMEHPIKADVDGTVAKVHVTKGAQVKTRQLLIEVIPVDGANGATAEEA